MTRLEYSPAALEKLGAIHKYIAEELQNPAGAANTLESIRAKIRALKGMPKIGAPLVARCPEIPGALKEARVLQCGKYIAIYLYEGNAVKILYIYHTAEDFVRHLL